MVRSICFPTVLVVLLAAALQATVISEIHYNAPAGGEGLEFIEISNDTTTPEDLSGWEFVEGIQYVFPPATILPAGGVLVLCKDVQAIRSHYGIDKVLGDYAGNLAGSGERVTLVNHAGIVIQSVDYDDEGKWPVGPDGTGYTLSLKSLYLDPSEPESWRRSVQRGGTPGAPTFPRVNPFELKLPRRPEVVEPRPELVFNELFRSASANEGWVELYNAAGGTIDLSGYHLTDDADRVSDGDTFTFPSGRSLASGDFIVVNEGVLRVDFFAEEVRLFLLRPDATVVAAHVFRHTPSSELALGTYSDSSFPDGGRPQWLTLTPTRGTPNQVAREENLVINEIFYHPPDENPGEPRSEFLELFNRGTTPIDLTGFHFTRGIDYEFVGTDPSIGPGEYLVLAKDPALLAEHHAYDGALGPYEGFLANGGENIRVVDRLGNLVDEVRYHEGGEWSLWADGRGASLELIDPFQDNDFATAWGASDESEKAAWEELSYQVADNRPSEEDSELHLFLVEKGICHIDDLSVTPSGGANIIPNPGFEDETTRPWIIEGTHIDSRRITTDSHSGNACLEMVATGAGNSRVNRLEVDTNPALTTGPYDVSLRARWQRGTSVIVTHANFTDPLEGDPMGSTLAGRLRMTVPLHLGTPGTENSIRRGNLGPMIGEVIHSPATPMDSEPIAVRARVSDSDGVAEVRVQYRVDPEPDFHSQPLFDDGLHADGEAGDGVYGGQIPGFAVETTVGFYVEATDSLGNTLRTPPVDKTHVVLVVDSVERTRDSTRILLDGANTALLKGRQVHSNDLLHGTFVLNESQVYYNVGIRFRGSPWGRTDQQNFRVRFAPERPFLRGFKDLNVTRRGLRGGTDEGAAYFVIGRVGTPDMPNAVPDYFYVDGWFNERSMRIQAAVESVNTDHIERWYGEDMPGPVLKANGRIQFNDAGLEGVDWASLNYKGENAESYRHYWKHSLRQTADNWQPFIDFCKLMDPLQTPDELFDANIEKSLDVERFFRTHAARMLMGDGDALFIAHGHNGYMVFDADTGLWSLVAFDMDGSFNQSTSLFIAADRGVGRLFKRPLTLRTYYRVLEHYVDGYWSEERAGPWLESLTDATSLNTNDIRQSLRNTSDFLREELQRVDRDFEIHSTESVFTSETTIELEGQAPVRARRLEFTINGGPAKLLTPTWTSVTGWIAEFELSEGSSSLEVMARDAVGQIVGSGSVTIVSSAFANFQRGEVTGEGGVNLNDVVAILGYLFQHGPMSCLDAADVEDDGRVTVLDAIRLVLYLFSGGQEPAVPFQEPGPDPTADNLDCSG